MPDNIQPDNTDPEETGTDHSDTDDVETPPHGFPRVPVGDDADAELLADLGLDEPDAITAAAAAELGIEPLSVGERLVLEDVQHDDNVLDVLGGSTADAKITEVADAADLLKQMLAAFAFTTNPDDPTAAENWRHFLVSVPKDKPTEATPDDAADTQDAHDADTGTDQPTDEPRGDIDSD